MAIKQDNTTKLEMTITEGTKAELVATGYLKPEWFPGTKGNHKNEVTIEGAKLCTVVSDPTVEKLIIFRSDEGVGIFCVEVVYTKDEQFRRERIERAHYMESAYKEASILAKKSNEDLPDSVESFRKYGARMVEKLTDINFKLLVSENGGYSFDKKTVQSFNNTLGVLCDVLISGGVKFEQFNQDKAHRENARNAFNTGLCLALTGYERNALIERFMRESSATLPA